jgi:hypothetical protein
MKFLVLIYNEPALLDALPPSEFDTTMRGCFDKADQLKKDGKLLESRMLQAPSTAKSIRVRNGRQSTLDGPFAETKEVLGGFNLIEAEDMEEALLIAEQFPWSQTGCVEVRPLEDMDAVRQRVNAEPSLSRA